MNIEEKASASLEMLLPIDLEGIETAALPAPPFVIEGLVPRRVVTLLGGHGGAGKSILGLTLCAHIAGGAMSWGGHRLEDGHALFVSLEDPGELVRYRLRNILEAYGLNSAKIRRRLRAVDGTTGDGVMAHEFSDMGLRKLVFTSVLQEVRACAAGCRLIVIDNASDAYDGNENDRRLVRAFMRGLADLAREHDAGVILLVHIDKAAARFGGNGNTFSGSTAWHNSARSRLALIEDDGTITLSAEKLNLGRKADPIPLTWTDGGVLVPALVQGGAAGADDATALLAALQAAREAGVDVGAARTGPTTAQHVLGTFPQMPERLRGTKGRSAFWNALGQLLDTGRVRIAEITTSSRHLRKVLLLAPGAEPAQIESARANSPHPYALIGAHEGAPVCGSSRQSPIPEPAQTRAADYRAAKAGE